MLDLLTTARKRALEPEKIDSLLAIVDEDLGYQLHQAVQRTKTALSQHESADFIFAGPDAGSVELRTSVTRVEFEQWIAPELTQIATAVDSLLASTSLVPSAITRVFLTGGTSFVPAVRAIFESCFPGRVVTGDEFTSVAQGLAPGPSTPAPANNRESFWKLKLKNLSILHFGAARTHQTTQAKMS